MTTTISNYLHLGTVGDWATVETEVRFTKRSYGGWIVRRADNGRELGWLVKIDGLWEARVSSSAFRGDGIDDLGYILDDVPLYLFRGDSTIQCRPVSYGDTREDAATDLVYWLHDHKAPALGYGRHYAVKPYRPLYSH